MSRLMKTLVAGATALGLIFTPITASAGPDRDDIAKALAGLVILGITAKAIDNRNDRRDRARSVSRQPDFRAIEQPQNRRIIEGQLRRPGDFSARVDQGFKRRPLPDQCLRIVDTRRGDRLVYGERCLNRTYRHADKLPTACTRYIRTNRGLRPVFGARCLAGDGWQVARR